MVNGTALQRRGAGGGEVLISLYYFCPTINQKTRLEISKRVFL